MEAEVKNQIAQGVVFLVGIIAGVYLYRTGFSRGRAFQSVISRQSMLAEKRRRAFEPNVDEPVVPGDVKDADDFTEALKGEFIGSIVRERAK